MEKYKFVGLNHLLSDLLLPVLCILVFTLSDMLEYIKSGTLRIAFNVTMVLFIVSIYNRLANHLFKINCEIIVGDDCVIIRKGNKEKSYKYIDVDEIQVNIIDNVFGVSLGGKEIEFILKGQNAKTKIYSLRYFDDVNLRRHPIVNACNMIGKKSFLVLYEDIDGATIRLKKPETIINHNNNE